MCSGEVGDTITFRRRNGTHTGTVVDEGRIFIKVRWEENGREFTESIRPNDIVEGAGQRKLEDNRVWTDKTREFKVYAAYVDQDDSHVTIRKRDGLVKKVALDILCDEDRDYVAAMKNGGVIDEASPFSGGDSPDPDDDAFELAEKIELPETVDWSYEPTAVATAPIKGLTPNRPIRVSGGMRVRFSMAKSNSGATFGYVPHASSSREEITKPGEAFLVDLVAGKERRIGIPNRTLVLYDVHPDGEHIVVAPDRHSGGMRDIGPDHVSVIGPEGEVFRWKPTSDSFGKSRIESARFASDDMLIIQEADGRYVTWDWKTKSVKYTIESHSGIPPHLSADHRVVIISSSGFRNSPKGTYLIESASGATLGKIPGQPRKLAFSPDGTKLASYSSKQMVVMDLKTGELADQVAFLPSDRNSVNGEAWVGNNHFFAGGRIYDIESAVPIWRLRDGVSNSTVSLTGLGGGMHLVTLGRVVIPIQIPLEEILAKVESGPKKKVRTLQAGAKVKLDFDLELLPQADRDNIMKAIENTFQFKQLTKDDSSDIVLKAAVTKEPAKEAVVRRYILNRRRVPVKGSDKDNTFTVTPIKHVISLTIDGDEVFSREVVKDLNTMLTLQSPEDTIQQAIDRTVVPVTSVITSALSQVPWGAKVTAGGKDSTGSTTITEQGIR